MSEKTIRIRGGTIQTPSGGTETDLLISGEKVAALLDPASPVSATHDIEVFEFRDFTLRPKPPRRFPSSTAAAPGRR